MTLLCNVIIPSSCYGYAVTVDISYIIFFVIGSVYQLHNIILIIFRVQRKSGLSPFLVQCVFWLQWKNGQSAIAATQKNTLDQTWT